MKILGIETSCDETSLAIIEANMGVKQPQFSTLAHNTLSQIDIHKEYGGVYPSLAKREHSKNLTPLLEKTLNDAKLLKEGKTKYSEKEMAKLLIREPEMLRQFNSLIPRLEKPDIEYIAVTVGPGLEPALWVGINFAKALSKVWNIPIIPVNHMKGHVFSVITNTKEEIQYPAVALLISGGHTELVLAKNWSEYKILGKTRDDAIGEAFDKVARIIGLPYPGGPEISKLAEINRQNYPRSAEKWSFPRPMINSGDLDFSFSGLKTSVLYAVNKADKITEEDKQEIAREFEDAVTEVLVSKTKKAMEKTGAKTLIVGGGVIANKHIRQELENLGVKTYFPTHKLSTDNALMISIAGYIDILNNILLPDPEEIKAQGNLKLDK